VNHSPTPSTALSIAVIDTETGGFEPASDPLLQVAVILATVDDGGSVEIDQEWASYVRLSPPWKPYGAQHIHGIRRRSLIAAPSEKRVITTVCDLIRGRTVIAHNIAFDMSFLTAAATRHGRTLEPAGTACTLEMSRATDPARTMSHRLGDISERFNIALTGAHDALNDARATLEVLHHLIRTGSALLPADYASE